MEGEGEGDVGGVCMESLACVDMLLVDDELREEGPGRRVVGDDGLVFGRDEFPVGSIA